MAARTSSAVARSFLAVTPLDDASAEAWLRLVRPVVDAGRLSAAGMADAYLGQYGAIENSPLSIPDEPFDLEQYRNGVTPDDVYMRSVIEARTAISNGASFLEAMQIGARSAAARADTDTYLANRDRESEIYSGSSNVQGFRRVPNIGACEFCLLISTRRYKKNELREVHTKCHCTTAPILGTKDPGIVVDKKLLAELKRDGIGVSRKTNRELGPVLVPG